MKVSEQINQILTKGLNPVEIQVVDQSHLHAGHAGARPEGKSNFLNGTEIASRNHGRRIERHRMVNSLLSELLLNQVHALSIKAFSPEDVVKK